MLFYHKYDYYRFDSFIYFQSCAQLYTSKYITRCMCVYQRCWITLYVRALAVLMLHILSAMDKLLYFMWAVHILKCFSLIKIPLIHFLWNERRTPKIQEFVRRILDVQHQHNNLLSTSARIDSMIFSALFIFKFLAPLFISPDYVFVWNCIECKWL